MCNYFAPLNSNILNIYFENKTQNICFAVRKLNYSMLCDFIFLNEFEFYKKIISKPLHR